MKASVRQAEEARKETQITNETMKKQQFETTFFNMLSLHHQIVEGIRMAEGDIYSGRDAITRLKEICEWKLAQEQYISEHPLNGEIPWTHHHGMNREYLLEFLDTPGSVNQEMLDKVYEKFHDEYGNAIGHYMRNNYRIVKFIVENVVENEDEQKRIKKEEKRDTIVGDKRFYFGTLRAQWSNSEFELIFINSLYERNKKFKNLIKNHDVLDILETDVEKFKGKQEGSFILKKDTPIPAAYNHLIEKDSKA